MKRWILALLGRRPSPEASLDETASRSDEREKRFANALRSTQNETVALRRDGSELAERIRRNAARARDVFEGKS